MHCGCSVFFHHTLEDKILPRKASARQGSKSAGKTSAKGSRRARTTSDSATRGSQSFRDRSTPAVDTSHIDPASPAGRRIAELQGQINEQAALAPAAAKPDYGASTMKMGGVTKILREAGDENTGKPTPTHIVQQGGGGAVDGNTGQPVR